MSSSLEKNENDIIFNKNDRDGILERLSQGIDGAQTEADRRMEEISNLLRRSDETTEGEGEDGKGTGIQEIRDRESRIALDYAKKNNIWIKNIYDLGEPLSEGNENTVVVNPKEGYVYKSNNLLNSQTLSNFFIQVKIHNELFPETKYELAGFTGIDNGKKRPPYIEAVVKQPLVKSEITATSEEIADFMKSLWFKKLNDSSFTNGEYSVSDLHPRNVLKDKNSNIYVIDDIIKQKANKKR